ncbi:DNA ligase D [Pseudoxanthomonas sacheonensis]|uniref:DNA ligase D n=1 Tax=Pseudoxanthomonas sacheonensis TaxID=443615 RepID=UPI0013D31BF3|nr:DNA ligase D [Pseudoxanthomonas sacheonensis]KAF1711589.1 DNA ligase D [Pseudoxanthomonas sacheonensis]
MSLRDYKRKRRFDETPEPDSDAGPAARRAAEGKRAAVVSGARHRPIFVVQLHHATARHYDFRLEADGVLKSWAVPKGPSLRTGEKRLAVEVEDHPLAYATFEGDIPEGNYGAGHVQVFDHGTWASEGDPLEAIAAGKLDFVLHGDKLNGAWKLVRTSMRGKQKQWLLIKREDEHSGDAEADDLLGKNSPRKKAGSGISATRAKQRMPLGSDAWKRRALAMAGARKGDYPAGFSPQLASSRETAPAGDGWLHEIKWDGYRMMADLVDGKVKLRSRGKLDWTATFPEVAQAVEALPVKDVRLDGELVVIDRQGCSDFSALQRAIDGTSKQPLRYVVFDMPGIAGVDLSHAALIDRKSLLKDLVGKRPGVIAYSEHVLGHGKEVFEASKAKGLEGIVSKRIDSSYSQSRSNAWAKVKHEDTDEFVIVGYTAPKGSRSGFGSLLVAVPQNGVLRYAGRVGTGFDDSTLDSLETMLAGLRTGTASVELPSHVPFSVHGVRWVKPVLIAEVAFRGWAKEGLLRQASFKRLREDKSMQDLDPSDSDEVTITHPDRIVYKKGKISKGDVAGYYRQVARWLLPELVERPLSLVRCPDGAHGQCFFQKHYSDALGKSVKAITLKQKSGNEDYLYLQDAAGLLELVQMNTLEFHPWGSKITAPGKPDRLVFDLDPGPGVGWAKVKAAARDVRKRLQQAGLQSYLRLSGGKGLHVVVPITPGPDWDQVKDFCGAFAEALAAHSPDKYVATMSKAKRDGVIFIDWLRNARGATSVCSWSLRAREEATVAMPLQWEELAKVTAPGMYTMARALQRAGKLRNDPWQGIEDLRQELPGTRAAPAPSARQRLKR